MLPMLWRRTVTSPNHAGRGSTGRLSYAAQPRRSCGASGRSAGSPSRPHRSPTENKIRDYRTPPWRYPLDPRLFPRDDPASPRTDPCRDPDLETRATDSCWELTPVSKASAITLLTVPGLVLIAVCVTL